MIEVHELNTRWWGQPVGIVRDPAFFQLGTDEQAKLLNPYCWVEFRSQMDQAPHPRLLAAAGFMQIDTQVQFLLNLSKVEAPAGESSLRCCFADEENFDVASGQLASFSHERFRHIPGCTEARTNERYALWAQTLTDEYPASCMQLYLGDGLQGWFLSCPGKRPGLNLSLAMLSGTAKVSGLTLYQQACAAYACRGHRLGYASFSITNTSVHNIYTTLGARFLPPSGNWRWVSPDLGRASNE